MKAEPTETLDYSLDTNWMSKEKNPTKNVDLIFLNPTVAMTADYMNGLSDITEEAKVFAQVIFRQDASAFEEYTNIYAPYFHSISLEKVTQLDYHGNFNLIRNSLEKRDVYAALDYYFKNWNHGRPFILAGHSQGSTVIQVILEEYMKNHPEYYKNMVAAYAIGVGIEQAWLDANPQVKAAQGETDTGVLISWNTEGPDATKPNFLLGTNTVLINPLNWKTDETYADKSENKGTAIYNQDGTVNHLEPGINDACINHKRGALICTTDTNYIHKILPLECFGDKSLHGGDYQIYYQNIKENGKKRIEAFLAQKK